MCGTATGNAGDPLARSLSISTLFMLSMPFLIFFSVAGWLTWRVRRASAAIREAQPTIIPKENPS